MSDYQATLHTGNPSGATMHNLYKLGIAVITSVLVSTAVAERQPDDYETLIDDPRVQHLHYVSTATGETIPYALFIPTSYAPEKGPSP